MVYPTKTTRAPAVCYFKGNLLNHLKHVAKLLYLFILKPKKWKRL